MNGLVAARRGFAAVTASDEDRHDADAYAAAIDAIIAFNRRDIDPVRLASARLDRAVSQHAAWLAGCYRPPWMANRRQEERAWQRLSVYLAAAVVPVSDDTWYHVDQALTVLFDAYQASRTFARYPDAAASTGVQELVRPVIEGAFIDNARNLSLLDRALADDPQFQHDDTARQLRDAVRAADIAAHHPGPPAVSGDRLGKAVRRAPATLRYFRADQAEILFNRLPAELQLHLENVLYDARIARAETGNAKVEDLLDDIERQLRSSADWPLAGGPFHVLVQQTVRFLVRCYNLGAGTGGRRTDYLRTSAGPTPKERALQADYLDWLKDGPFSDAVRAEVPDIGAGRADVVVDLPHFSFYIECKREESDASHDGLRRYVGQARAYSVTNVAFGILLVLDLTDHRTGIPDMFSSVWVELVQVTTEETPRHIVVIRVPGNRPVPSATDSPPRGQPGIEENHR